MTLPRLHPSTLPQLPQGVGRPAYDRAAHGVGVVHLGLGNFHRAHQAVYFDDLLAREGGDWRILGVSCRSPAVRDQLAPQDGLYSLAETSASGTAWRVVGSLSGVLVAPEDPQAVARAIAAPSTQLVTLTVTEKGYCRDGASGGVAWDHPDIVHDLAQPGQPRSVPGLLLSGLRERRRHGAPLTLLSCDNLPHNGAALRRVLLEFARQVEPGLADWIGETLAFPSSMVDRIVPATQDEDLQAGRRALGLDDAAVVRTERYTQWVVEDRFAGLRPGLDRVGVQLVDDVRPHELAKLRLLNGSHSTLAYLGSLLDIAHVHEAIADPDLAGFLRRLVLGELLPSLPPLPGVDLQRYFEALCLRFANPALQHRLRQIAMDGSQKLPQRLLQPLAERLARGEDVVWAVRAIAAWMRYLQGRTDSGVGYAIDDPLASRLQHAVAGASAGARGQVDALLDVAEIFGTEVPAHEGLRESLARALDELLRLGTRAALRQWLSQER